ncbi:helix-turn-helix domain-containing protein [Streptomyces yunnanensis]|uniref:Helix-turn-helix domain-containing protein n=1 Tax=Streptomyces yunnanensis TaxID=156453 RepID=A0ABY8A738_9ACTN|nr:helix-turn-helix transcriptional regulator [Streptomyces yunnanensis]WEB40775.1 helix-turn-helix domain-containing protein [Streptomyces yunnanensis]
MGLAERRKAMGYSQERLATVIGVDRTTVGRWDRGETTPEAVHRPKMAEALQLSLAELDALLTPPQADFPECTASTPCDRHGSEEIDDMIRREFLRLMVVTGSLTALAPDDADAIAEVADRGSAEDFSLMNGHLWQVYQLARSKSSVTAVVKDQLAALNEALKESSRAGGLYEVAGDLFQLAGELSFDGNRYTDAATSYTLAAKASSHARAFDLWACALVRHAYVDVYERRYSEAVETLDVAQRVAKRGDGALSTRHWVSSVQAEVYAGLQELGACEKALDEALRVADLTTPVHPGGWLRFDGSRLAEERGARYVQLGPLDLAEETLKRALESKPLSRGQSFRRRGAVLVDLAAVGAKRRDAEQVVTYGGEALRLAKQSHSGYVARRLQALQGELRTCGRDRRVVELNTEIDVLQKALRKG